MESKRGRPSAKLLDKYSFDLDKISNYFKENIKEQPKPEQEQPKPEQEQPKPEQEQPKPEQEQLNRAIVFDKNMLIKADIVVSAILESGLNLIGVKKEVLPINEKEADLLIEIMPPIQLEKNWTNFFLAYLTLKIVK
jgi:hypothetical protein